MIKCIHNETKLSAIETMIDYPTDGATSIFQVFVFSSNFKKTAIFVTFPWITHATRMPQTPFFLCVCNNIMPTCCEEDCNWSWCVHELFSGKSDVPQPWKSAPKHPLGGSSSMELDGHSWAHSAFDSPDRDACTMRVSSQSLKLYI